MSRAAAPYGNNIFFIHLLKATEKVQMFAAGYTNMAKIAAFLCVLHTSVENKPVLNNVNLPQGRFNLNQV